MNGGDVAATVAGVVDDVKTVMDSNASTGERVFAGLSLLSEAAPISVGDVKDVAQGIRKMADNVGDAAKRGSNTARFTNKEVKAIAERLGLTSAGKTKDGRTIYLNNGDGPKYLVKSDTSHTGDVFKGFDTKGAAEAGRTSKAQRAGSFDENLNRTAD